MITKAEAQEVYAAAEESSPTLFIYLPKMNEVFLFANEQNTFMVARAMLSLNPHATTAAVMSELRERWALRSGLKRMAQRRRMTRTLKSYEELNIRPGSRSLAVVFRLVCR